MGAFNSIGVQIVLWSMTGILLIFYSEQTVQELLAIPKIILGWFFKKTKMTWRSLALSAQESQRKKTLEEKVKTPSKALFSFDKKNAPKQLELLEDEDEQDAEPQHDDKALLAAPTRRKVILKVKPPRRIENWDMPKLSLLEDPPLIRVKVDKEEIRRKADLLTDKLKHFAVEGEIVAVKPGPLVTLFEFKPNADVKLSKITELQDDLSLALSSESLRVSCASSCAGVEPGTPSCDPSSAHSLSRSPWASRSTQRRG